MFANGQSVVNFISKLLTDLQSDSDQGFEQMMQPVSLLLLDINMPVLNGYETLIKVKELFKQVNENNPKQQFVRPMICYLSQTDQAIMKQFLTEEENAEAYLDKPVSNQDLTSLMRLIDKT